MALSRSPLDIRVVEWAGSEDFPRVRAEWFELIRRDPALLPVAKVVLWDIGSRMAFDRSDAWPSIQRLAAELALSEPTVKRAIAQVIERGWLVSEKRRFGGSNHYSMAKSRSVENEVSEARDNRIANFKETRRLPIRSSVIPLGDGANQITGDPSMRSSVISQSDHTRSLNQITGDPLSLSENTIKEPQHRSLSQGPSKKTVQDKSLGAGNDLRAQILACAAKRGVDRSLLDRAGSINGETQARELLIEVFGDGDHQLGLKRLAAAGQRTRWLMDEIDTEGAEAMLDAVVSTLEFVLRSEVAQPQKAKVAS